MPSTGTSCDRWVTYETNHERMRPQGQTLFAVYYVLGSLDLPYAALTNRSIAKQEAIYNLYSYSLTGRFSTFNNAVSVLGYLRNANADWSRGKKSARRHMLLKLIGNSSLWKSSLLKKTTLITVVFLWQVLSVFLILFSESKTNFLYKLYETL